MMAGERVLEFNRFLGFAVGANGDGKGHDWGADQGHYFCNLIFYF